MLHSGGSINAGTTTINPAALGGGQRQTAHTTDLADFGPFLFATLGGTATNPCRLVDTATGAGGWIASGSGSATASLSRPVTASGAAGSITIGDAYQVQRGSRLELGTSPAPSSSGGVLTFTDFALNLESVGPVSLTGFTPSGAAYTRCSFLAPLGVSGQFSDCAFGDGAQGVFIADVSAGLWVPNADNDQLVGVLNLSGDTYITSGPHTNRAFVCGNTFYTELFVTPGIGAGLQVQDMRNAHQSLLIDEGAIVLPQALVWGNGNTGYGVTVQAGARFIVQRASVPTVTGALGDFAFQETASVFTTVARSWNDAVGSYTEAGGPPTRTTTWANFVAALGGGGLNFNAHDVAIDAHLIGL